MIPRENRGVEVEEGTKGSGADKEREEDGTPDRRRGRNQGAGGRKTNPRLRGTEQGARRRDGEGGDGGGAPPPLLPLTLIRSSHSPLLFRPISPPQEPQGRT